MIGRSAMMKWASRFAAGMFGLVAMNGALASSQEQDVKDPLAEPVPMVMPEPQIGPLGQTAEAAVGRVGQRQLRTQKLGRQPMARIQSRLNSRIEARIQNRIDRNYEVKTDTTSSFEAAEEETLGTRRQ